MTSASVIYLLRTKLKYVLGAICVSTLLLISGLSKQFTNTASRRHLYRSRWMNVDTGFVPESQAPLFDVRNASGAMQGAFRLENLVPVRNEFVYERLNWITSSDFFNDLVARKPDNDDPQVLQLIRRMMDPPSQRMRKHSLPPYETPQSLVLEEVIDVGRRGFFVECGALDGERSSNTNFLESKFDWQGLLIEADPSYYTQLLGKNRKAWSINACLSPVNRTSFITFGEMRDGRGHVMLSGTEEKFKSESKYIVPCFTLESMMLALNRTTIGFFSLDVEGAEVEV